MKYAHLNNEEILEGIEAVDEQLGEIECQHRSECALFGDSWPGAQLQIAEIRSHLGELRTEAEARGLLDPAGAEAFGNDDIPF